MRLLLLLLVVSLSSGYYLAPPDVTVELYYETYCPGCKAFVTTELYPTFDQLKDSGRLRIGMYPYGNAQEKQLPDGTWNFTCQHGQHECDGNLLEACIMNLSSWKESLYLPVLSCMEGSDDPVQSARGCVSSLSKLKFSAVQKCAKGKQGNLLMHKLAQKTGSLKPGHTFVPWIVINGVHNSTLQMRAQADLKGLVCQLIQGEKPRECSADLSYEEVEPIIEIIF